MTSERVQGVGGLFLRADDPDELRRWYSDVLGVVDGPDGVWRQPAGPTVFATFSRESDYFPERQQVMLNFRVADLEAMLRQLEAAEIAVLGTGDQAGVGRFAWIADPEGNRIELWEPAADR